MDKFEIIAEERTEAGKSASRNLRHQGKLPGIIYGNNKKETMITLDQNDLMHHLEHEAFYSHILNLKIGKQTEKVVLKDMQRHPYKNAILHIDLQRINEKQTLTMRIPLHYLNEDKCEGIKQGGVLNHLITEIDVVCLPKDLPEYIEVDVMELELDQTLHLSDLKLPESVQIHSLLHGGTDNPIATLHLPRVKKADAEDDAVAEEGEQKPEDTET